METIGIYNNTTLTANPEAAMIFAIIGWIVVLMIMAYALYKWYKKPAETAR
ncbi:MAG: hypothetical protein QXJ69_01245 [Desulfurococcaceae archaeon]